MSPLVALFLYSVGVVLAALAGGALPLASRGRGVVLERFLAASAGIMLGVLGGHLIPEALHGGPKVAWALVGGFVFLLVLERFVLPHALHAPHEAEAHEDCPPEIEADHVRHEAAGAGAFVGLGIHTLFDGVALGTAALEAPAVAPWVFSAIVVHKLPSAFALSSLLLRAGVRSSRVALATAGLGALVGAGAFAFVAVRGLSGLDLASFMPWALAFSAGSFLHVVVTDLLPDLHRPGPQRLGLVLSLVAGLVLMVVLGAVFEG